jgi:hypothetical protein
VERRPTGGVIFFDVCSLLPSPLVGEGGSLARSGSEMDEGFVSADRDPLSGATRHLLPQGEKGRGSVAY